MVYWNIHLLVKIHGDSRRQLRRLPNSLSTSHYLGKDITSITISMIPNSEPDDSVCFPRHQFHSSCCGEQWVSASCYNAHDLLHFCNVEKLCNLSSLTYAVYAIEPGGMFRLDHISETMSTYHHDSNKNVQQSDSSRPFTTSCLHRYNRC